MTSNERAAAAANEYLQNKGRQSAAELANKYGVDAASLRVRIARVRLMRALDR